MALVFPRERGEGSRLFFFLLVTFSLHHQGVDEILTQNSHLAWKTARLHGDAGYSAVHQEIPMTLKLQNS